MQYPQYNTPRFETRPPVQRVNFGWLTEAFDLFKQQPVVWIVSTLVCGFGPYILNMVVTLISEYATGAVNYATPVTNINQLGSMYVRLIPTFIISTLVYMGCLSFLGSGLLRIAIRQVQGQLVDVGDLFKGWPSTMRMFGLGMIMQVVSWIMVIPFVILVMDEIKGNPSVLRICLLIGAYVLILLVLGTLSGLVMPAFALIADGEKVFRAVSRSLAAMKHDWIRASLLLFLYGIINFLSVFTCGLGYLVTIPMGALMLAIVYRDMLEMPPPPDVYAQYTPPPPSEGVWPPPPAQH